MNDKQGNSPEVLLLNVFAATKPMSSNKEEWAAIRESAERGLAKTKYFKWDEALNEVLKAFSTTNPREDNIEEWKELRSTAATILMYSSDSREARLRQLIYGLQKFQPAVHNIEEWNKIREVAGEVLEMI